MGGLDARYMIAKLDMSDRVLSLTTVGTPHRGCSFADWGVRLLGWILRPVLRFLCISSDAFINLTTERCRRFNEEVRDVPGVRYRSVAGQCAPALLWPVLRLPARVVGAVEGPNDGVVSIASATYGEACDLWEADHLSLVNWPNRRWPDRAEAYARLAADLP
jgi:triacylglycerol lipase